MKRLLRPVLSLWRAWRVDVVRCSMIELYHRAKQDGTRAAFRRYAEASHHYFDLRRYYKSNPL